MRQLVAAGVGLVILAAVAVAALRLLDTADAPPVDERAAATAAATAWAEAASAGDVDALVELAAGRVDTDVLASTTSGLWEALGAPPTTTVAEVVVADRTAVATLDRQVPVADAGAWSWRSELALERAQGRWRAVWEPTAEHPRLARRWTIGVVDRGPERAPLLDRLGRSLSGATDLVEVGVQPGRLPDDGRAATVVAEHLPEARAALAALLERDDLRDDWFYRLVVVDAARADEAWPGLLGVPGLLRRPAGDGAGDAPFAPELLGRVELRDGAPVGASGLQLLLDERLRGSNVFAIELRDPEGDVREVLDRVQADPSPPLVTTLDRDLQQALQDALRGEQATLGVVAVDVDTGGLVATTSLPATGFARALEGRYPPGTAGGVVPVTAALLAGRAPTDAVPCADLAVAGGVTVVDVGPDGDDARALRDVLAPGCATGVATLGADLGATALAEAGSVLGLDGAVDGVLVPAVGWEGVAADASDAAVGSGAVGQARVTTSTLAAAAAVATVARGAPVAPHVLADEPPPAGSPLPDDVATDLRQALQRAGAAGPVAVSGTRVAGVVGRTGVVRGDPAPATGWWLGWVVEGGPRVALAVTVEGDDGTRAAAVAQRVLAEMTG